MNDLIQTYLRFIKEIRSRKLSEAEYESNLKRLEKDKDPTSAISWSILYNLSKLPRTEILSISKEVVAVLTYPRELNINDLRNSQSWNKPWIIHVHFEDDNNDYIYQHCCVNNATNEQIHLFDIAKHRDGKLSTVLQFTFNTKKNELSAANLDISEGANIDEIKQDMICHFLLAFHLFLLIEQNNGTIEITKLKKRHNKKGKININNNGTIFTTISLSAKGKHYIYENSTSSSDLSNTNHRNIYDYCKIQVIVKPFTRKQRVGPGRTKIKEIVINSFKRATWIRKKDKVVRIEK
jgi:hypothetical protein